MSPAAHRSWTFLIAAGVFAVAGGCEKAEPEAPRAGVRESPAERASNLSDARLAPPKKDDEATPANGPTDAQLAALRSDLMIPVEGVYPEDLRDTFTEARGKRQHAALDILAARGATVVSATAGRILQLSSSKTGGLMIFAVDASGQFLLLYAHLDRYARGLTGGMPVFRGQPLGEVGTTGNAPPDTPHLHFAIAWTGGSLRWSRGIPIDPRRLLVRTVATVGSSREAERGKARASVAGDPSESDREARRALAHAE